MLDKIFQPRDVEQRLYKLWEESGAFRGGDPDRVAAGARPYCIVIPPPNVTGSLHMGHALNNTLQDILIRFERMRGKDVLWQPGTDHAGIATQMVVERQLAAESDVTRHDMGRDAFVERIWQWKVESGGTIINQLRRLGASCDWSRERFTMDKGLSKAVAKVFVQLYREGLIYKDNRLVNWDPKLLTAISDLEVVQREVKGHLWHFRYPIEGRDGEHIMVATTRPETMLGDTAVAVNPEDERYRDLIGQHVVLPLVGRRIPIIGDEHADPEQGSGAVKITPAHDFNDFEVGRRHDLPMINIFDAHACLNENAPEPYCGMDRYAARKAVVADLEAQGLLDKIDDHVLMVPYGDRSNEVIEPWLTEQWYVDAKTLAQPALRAVEQGETVFVPRNWEKTYFEWMRNIQPWCISRQLWWGHQIPAWYGPYYNDENKLAYELGDGGKNKIFAGESEDEVAAEAVEFYGKPVQIVDGHLDLITPEVRAEIEEDNRTVFLWRDADVLDTWFSSALWPFSTLGWPDKTPELARYYKTDALVTGFDIIFFWVARMMMMGLHFMEDVPFHTVYIHALVRDEKGQKMSKSKGNVMDPLELVDTYGADALRFTLAAMAAQGRDIKMSTSRVEGYRNFGTKLWNAARFCEMNACAYDDSFDPEFVQQTVNRWIVGEAARTSAKVTEEIEAYRFNDAAAAVYRFTWNVYCDWYLEFIKPLLSGSDATALKETRATAAWVLDEILRVLHPFMPFITEELWQKFGNHATLLMTSSWPQREAAGDASADAEMDWVIRLISEVRSVRSEMNVPAGAKIPLLIKDALPENLDRLARHHDLILRLARLESTEPTQTTPDGAIQLVHGEATILLPLGGIIDFAAETARLKKEVSKLDGDIAKIDAKLANEKFISRAPQDVIDEQRDRKAEAETARTRMTDALERLKSAV